MTRQRQTKKRKTTGTTSSAPHETSVKVSTALSKVSSRLECKLNQFQSAIQTSKARTEALASVDQDLAATKRLIASILTGRNMLVQISILPAEILAHIFHFYALQESPNPIGWFHVTHVCHRWRQIALDDLTFWAHFSPWRRNRNKEWISERLSRARDAPLVIELDGGMGKDQLSLFPPHISHTRELFIPSLSAHLSEVLQEITIQKAPALERLELTVHNASVQHLIGRLFFKEPLPELRVLSISRFPFPWSLVPRCRLTQLNVTLDKEDITLAPGVSPPNDLNQLIDLLVNCPALEVLKLKNCLPATISRSSAGQTICLPRLSRLYLIGSSSRITNLFKMLKLSSSATLRLDITPEGFATIYEPSILPVLSEHFSGPPVEFRSLIIYIDHIDHVTRMVASTSTPTSPMPHAHIIQEVPKIDAELTLTFIRVPDFKNQVNVIVRRVCEALPFSRLEFLSIFSPIMTRPPFNWDEVFRHFTEVTMVQLCGHGTIGLLQALISPEPSRGKGPKRGRGRKGRGTRRQTSASNNNDDSVSAPVLVPIFPKLNALLLEKMDLNKELPGSGALHDLVLRVVKQRKAKKEPLSMLYPTHCKIGAEAAAALEKVVRDFQLDHHGCIDEDDDCEVEDDDCYVFNYHYNFDDYSGISDPSEL